MNIRMEPAIRYRGLHIRTLVMPWMGLAEFQKLLDQMAKMKSNYLEFYWYVGSPWIEYSYRGEKVLIGDLFPRESNYQLWRITTGNLTEADVKIGREHFKESVFAPEFRNCDTPEKAFAASQKMLSQMIDYAHQRKIQVRLGSGDCPGTPPNLGRFARNGHIGKYIDGILIPPMNRWA